MPTTMNYLKELLLCPDWDHKSCQEQDDSYFTQLIFKNLANGGLWSTGDKYACPSG